MTYFLLWCHSTSTMRVQSFEWLLSRGREAYTGNRPLDLVPIAQGTRDEMEATREHCRATLQSRRDALPRDAVMLLDEPVPVAPARALAEAAQ